MSDLIRSLNKMIAELPVETRIYPGHGPETDIASEKMYNPFLTDIFNN
jgi:hydroxyacylglutathione hydrolase